MSWNVPASLVSRRPRVGRTARSGPPGAGPVGLEVVLFDVREVDRHARVTRERVVRTLQLHERLVPGDAQVGALFDGAAVGEDLRDGQLRLAGERRVPEEDLVDGPCLLYTSDAADE